MFKGFSLPLLIMALVLFLFGFIAVTAPNMTVQTLMLYLAYMLAVVGSICGFVSIVIRKSTKKWWLTLLMGLIFLAIAIGVFFNINNSAKYYTLFIASWAALMGAALLIASLYQKQLKIVLIVNGLMSVGFGLVIYFNPFTGTNTLNFMVGFYTILLSVMLFYLAYRISRLGRKMNEPEPETLA
jgi:uncharacterized membrane protein HdeD (DUF308 family)